MTDEEKEAFLKDVPAVEQFRMAEGNPHQTSDVTSGDEALQPILVKFINGDKQND